MGAAGSHQEQRRRRLVRTCLLPAGTGRLLVANALATLQKRGGVVQVVVGARIHAVASAPPPLCSVKASVHTHRGAREVAFGGGPPPSYPRRLSHKPTRLYEIDNGGFRRPRGTASAGRNGLSATEKPRSGIGALSQMYKKSRTSRVCATAVVESSVPCSSRTFVGGGEAVR